jgi:signal transduction histidine kinase
MEARHGVTCVVLSDKRPKPLDKDLEVVLFQAVRELLANVGKHAKATRVKVELSRKEDSVHISVGDNGIGFDVNSIGGWGNELGGFGLFSVRERLLLLGGRLEISSAPGSGTKITLVAPLGSGKGK